MSSSAGASPSHWSTLLPEHGGSTGLFHSGAPSELLKNVPNLILFGIKLATLRKEVRGENALPMEDNTSECSQARAREPDRQFLPSRVS